MIDSDASPTGDLRVTSQLTIPADELQLSFQTSGGPGGQHANRSATGVTLIWPYASSSVLSDSQRSRLTTGLGPRGEGGAVRVVADKSRSQWRNRSLARTRLAELVRAALVQQTPRRPTKPSRAARTRRMDGKRRRGETKTLRRRPEPE